MHSDIAMQNEGVFSKEDSILWNSLENVTSKEYTLLTSVLQIANISSSIIKITWFGHSFVIFTDSIKIN